MPQSKNHDPNNADARALSLEETCARIGISRRSAERLLSEGRFPIPPLPRVTRRWRFSSYDVDLYLREASTADSNSRTRGR
jgi:predicted DNA-binding transcriptional regulator AlpA